MAGDLVILELAGEGVTFDEFAAGVAEFRAVVQALQEHEAPEASIEWTLERLAKSSAKMGFRGRPLNRGSAASIPKVTRAYREVGEALRDGRLDRWPASVQGPARRLGALINGHVKSITLGSDEEAIEVREVAKPALATGPLPMPHWGAVTGRIEGVNSHGGLRFTLYERVSGRAVECTMAPGQNEMLRELWDKLVTVEGLVTRDRETGQAKRISQIKVPIVIHDESDADAWKQAIGAAPPKPGGPSPEDAIRRGRE